MAIRAGSWGVDFWTRFTVSLANLRMKGMMEKWFVVALLGACGFIAAAAEPYERVTEEPAGNPIVANIGLDDGHFRAYGDRLYNYACHDYSPDSRGFVLKKWWVWSTQDLVTWTFESALEPTVLGFPQGYKDCWATDAQTRNGKYYWYVCNPENTYVVRSDTPVGPWEAPLGDKPLMPGRDPSVFIDDDGTAYLVTGVWQYQIAALGEDMISLRESPRTVEIINPRGPYNHNGEDPQHPTDDKPYLHKHNGKYYLSWGCYYGVADQVYGPYTYKGCFIVPERTEAEFAQPVAGLTHDRHGSFFEWNNQTYFNCNDLSSNGAHSYWRNTVIMYVHYRDNGEIEPVYLNRLGVGQYDASGPIEAENFYASDGGVKKENGEGGFEMRMTAGEGELRFQHVHNLPSNARAVFRVATPSDLKGGAIEVWRDGEEPVQLGRCELPASSDEYVTVGCRLDNSTERQDLRLVFLGDDRKTIRLDYIRFE